MNSLFRNKILKDESLLVVLDDNNTVSLASTCKDNIYVVLCKIAAYIYNYTNEVYINKYVTVNYINHRNDAIYGIFTYKKNIIVAFKGTSSTEDILRNIDVKPVVINSYIQIPGKLHKGFTDLIVSNRLYLEIMNDLIKYNTDNKVIYVIGHSLGGALATIFYAYLKTQSKDKIHLVTFGSPKVGNSEFNKYIDDSENIRFVNGKDLVPILPIGIGYTHTDKELVLKNNLSCWEKLKLWSIDDHSIMRYYLAIKNEVSLKTK